MFGHSIGTNCEQFLRFETTSFLVGTRPQLKSLETLLRYDVKFLIMPYNCVPVEISNLLSELSI